MRIPFLYLFSAWAGGILLAEYVGWQPSIAFVVGMSLMMLFAWWGIDRFVPTLFWFSGIKYLKGGLLIACFVPLGAYRMAETKIIPNNDVSCLSEQFGIWEGFLISEAPFSEFGRTAWIETDSVTLETSKTAVSGKVLLQINKKESTFIRSGDRITFKGRLDTLKKGKNEGYYAYLMKNGIRHQIRAVKIEKTGRIGGMQGFFLNLRQYWENLFYNKIPSEKEAGLGIAIMLGERSYLDQDLKKAYAQTGLSHLIALSGSHIAILLLAMNFFWQLTGFLPIPAWFRAVLMAVLLVAYIILTGLSPSVVRATIMGILFLIARLYFFQRNILNLLCAAAFFQVFFTPGQLFDIGFQLSYLAVIGIVGFYLPLRKLLPFFPAKLKFLQSVTYSVVDVFGVCLTATLFTLPTTIYYFGMISNWFLPANVLASVPVTVGTVVGFLFLALGELPFVGDLLAGVLFLCLKSMNRIAEYFALLPHPTTTYSLTEGQVLGAYVFLLGLTLGVRWWAENRLSRKKYQIIGRKRRLFYGHLIAIKFYEIIRSYSA